MMIFAGPPALPLAPARHPVPRGAELTFRRRASGQLPQRCKAPEQLKSNSILQG